MKPLFFLKYTPLDKLQFLYLQPHFHIIVNIYWKKNATHFHKLEPGLKVSLSCLETGSIWPKPAKSRQIFDLPPKIAKGGTIESGKKSKNDKLLLSHDRVDKCCFRLL